MANRTYLRRSDFAEIYPSHQNPDYDDHEHTVACGAYRLPLLWTALFRLSDLRTRSGPSDNGEPVSLEAPIAEAERALAQFEKALPLFRSTFPDLRSLDSDAAELRKMIHGFRGKFLTIEWHELEMMGDVAQFRSLARQLLAFLDDPTMNLSPFRRRIFERIRPARSQMKLRHELLSAHSEIAYDLKSRRAPDLIGEPWTKESQEDE